MSRVGAGGFEPRDGRQWASAAPGVSLRPAVADDLASVARIEQASFSDPWNQRSFESVLRDQRAIFTVATLEDGRVAGYVVAWFVADEGEIANLAVSPAARRRHVGSTMLDATIRLARTHHVTSLYLEVRDSNVAARALYNSRGFVEVGRRRAYYRKPVEDARVLRLVLPES